MADIDLCKSVFQRFDEDSNDSLDGFEFVSLCSSVGMTALPIDLRRIFTAINSSKSGQIKFEEFLDFWLDEEDISDVFLARFRKRLHNHYVSPQAAANFRNKFVEGTEDKNISILPLGPVQSVKMGVHMSGGFDIEAANELFKDVPESLQMCTISRMYFSNPEFPEKVLKALVESTRESGAMRVSYERREDYGFEVKVYKGYESEEQVQLFALLSEALGGESFSAGLLFPWTSASLGALDLTIPQLLNFEASIPAPLVKALPGEFISEVYSEFKRFIRKKVTKSPVESDVVGIKELVNGDDVYTIDFKDVFDEIVEKTKDGASGVMKNIKLFSEDGEPNTIDTNIAEAAHSFGKKSLRSSEEMIANFVEGSLNVLDVFLLKIFERDSYETDQMDLRMRSGLGGQVNFFGINHLQVLSSIYNVFRAFVSAYIEGRRRATDAKRGKSNEDPEESDEGVVYEDYTE